MKIAKIAKKLKCPVKIPHMIQLNLPHIRTPEMTPKKVLNHNAVVWLLSWDSRRVKYCMSVRVVHVDVMLLVVPWHASDTHPDRK
jgi:hypothetical protein